MSKKSISINPVFFKMSGKSEKRKKKSSFDKTKLKPNQMKRKFIQKIKEHQKKEKEKELLEKNVESENFKNDFQTTLDYLESMKQKKRKERIKKQKRKTLKNTQIKQNIEQNIKKQATNIDINPMNIKKDPPYGCLKNGSKPTWKQYNKTLKKNKSDILNEFKEKPPFFNLKNNENLDFNERKDKLEKLKLKFNPNNKPNIPTKYKIKTKRIRRKITLGKNIHKRLVGVLVKNKKTRKIIKKEVDILKKKSIQEVKKYLRNHNLIKIGSNAPDNVLRTIYENAYLSGNINNNNSDVLLHNWHENA
jgi:hypothetical protein